MLEFILSGMIGVMCRYCRDRTRSSPARTMAFMYEFLDGAVVDRIRGYLDRGDGHDAAGPP